MNFKVLGLGGWGVRWADMPILRVPPSQTYKKWLNSPAGNERLKANGVIKVATYGCGWRFEKLTS